MRKLTKVKKMLEDFEEGDLIHRICPINHALIKGDRGFIEEPIKFLGIDKGNGLWIYQWAIEFHPHFNNDIATAEIDFWDDGNWRMWPKTFVEKLRKKYQKRNQPPN